MIFGIVVQPQILVVLGLAALLVLVLQMLVGYRKIHFKGKKHLADTQAPCVGAARDRVHPRVSRIRIWFGNPHRVNRDVCSLTRRVPFAYNGGVPPRPRSHFEVVRVWPSSPPTTPGAAS